MTIDVTVVIPTFGRDRVLVDTLRSLMALRTRAAEMIVVDQSPTHDEETTAELLRMEACGEITWARGLAPSITGAMNFGLRMASSSYVLFLDDDILPRSDLALVHHQAHQVNPALWATVGQVVQPWQDAEDAEAPRGLTGLRIDEDFPFHSQRIMSVQNVMAGNLCVHRTRALEIGGFDENFGGSAFRFETEFARRVVKAGGPIQFLGDAGIDHLRAERGGTRQTGSHLTSADPKHGIGDHYYAFLHGRPLEAWLYCCRRVVREVSTRFHLGHPWWIPIKLVGEIRALWGGRQLARRKKTPRKEDA